jgi:hypothetical protein
VTTLKEGLHSGGAGGIVPSSFRIVRHVLDRLEDSATGRILVDALHVDIPAQRIQQAQVRSSLPLPPDSVLIVVAAAAAAGGWWRRAGSGCVPGQEGLPRLAPGRGCLARPHRTRGYVCLWKWRAAGADVR